MNRHKRVSVIDNHRSHFGLRPRGTVFICQYISGQKFRWLVVLNCSWFRLPVSSFTISPDIMAFCYYAFKATIACGQHCLISLSGTLSHWRCLHRRFAVVNKWLCGGTLYHCVWSWSAGERRLKSHTSTASKCSGRSLAEDEIIYIQSCAQSVGHTELPHKICLKFYMVPSCPSKWY